MKIENVIDKDFRGAISIKKNKESVFQNAYGYADLPNEIRNEINTRFATASAGKVFVAVGILKLVEEEKLSLDDTIGGLVDFDLNKIDKSITVKQLLNHTSGIPDYFDESIMDEYDELWIDFPNYKIRKSSDLLPLFIDKPMMYGPGDRFKYNNTGFVVLGLIIEKVTGLPFDTYLKEQIFDPCGMLDTGYYELDRLPARCANAYIFDEVRKEFYTNIYSVDVKGTGAGGAFTTVLDIDKFWENLIDGKLVSKSMVEQMLTVQSSDDDTFYGYGIWLSKNDEDRYIPYFQGSDPGVSFISSYDIKNKTSITIASNFGDNVWKLRRELGSIL
ncbi:serine hydrolase domain-containing protein [Fusibacter bizertensis]|uniref:Serine hydrolase domain-containing protein n=1 Tax=Fusibacter bizertensis TaxID=1488331 RepID=A0ABT6NH38_9FIRM|nr:serine hydrolase domain-containing protein [Fusibacter bizertensis]MDH8679740.1 serine hydrolase domain-containing protein [Fusibacter bizertensis]